MTKRHNQARKSGFTVVELCVVVAVIGLLVGVGIMGYGQWRRNIAQREVQSDLTNAGAAMENARNFGNGYPLALPSNFAASKGVTLTYKAGGTASAYCLNASSVRVPTVVYYLASTNGNRKPAVGTCP